MTRRYVAVQASVGSAHRLHRRVLWARSPNNKEKCRDGASNTCRLVGIRPSPPIAVNNRGVMVHSQILWHSVANDNAGTKSRCPMSWVLRLADESYLWSPSSVDLLPVSTVEQVAGTSLDSQRAMCEKYCEARGWTIEDVFVDEGVSGAARSRPALDELLRSVRRKDADVVVVAKLDRLGRTMRGLVEWMSDWDDHGVTLVSVSESFDSSSSAARMQRNLLAMFAEFERDRIAERTSEGRDATVTIGGWPGGPPPFGWRLARTKTDRVTRLELDNEEVETIRRAVHLFVSERKGTTEIFRTLNAKGRPSEGTRTHGSHNLVDVKGEAAPVTFRVLGWNVDVSQPSDRPSQGRQGATDRDADSTIDVGVRTGPIRRRLAETAAPKFDRGDRGPYLLSRRLRSPHGTPMYGAWRTKRHTAFYTCGHTQKTNGWPRCGCRNIEVQRLEEMVWRTITDQLFVDIGIDAGCALADGLADASPDETQGVGRGATGVFGDRVQQVLRLATGLRTRPPAANPHSADSSSVSWMCVSR